MPSFAKSRMQASAWPLPVPASARAGFAPCRAARDLGFSRSLNPRLQTRALWLGANKDRIPLG